MKRLFAACAMLFLSLAAFGQEYRGAISGAVTDRTGAVIPGAKVTVTETQKGTKIETVSESTGQYNVPMLLPGDYEIAVQAPGFKTFTRKGLHVGAGDHPVIDVQLEVGDVSQTVEVTADAPLLNTENGSVGQTITTKEIEDLPMDGGTPMMLAAFAMGVLATGQPSTVQPFASGGGASWSIAGAPSQTNELSIDGSPNTTWDGRMAYSGMKDAVLEVRVKAFETDAAYGHTGAGTINQVMKSGTNFFHGTVYETHRPTDMVANNFFNNKSGLPVAVTHYNQYGVTAGGPAMVPKLLDGRNRLFWFFGLEGMKVASPTTTFMTVPTAAQKQGDFSKLLTLPNPIVLYDPYTAVRSGSRIVRTAYPNNKIPAAQLSPIALKLLQYFPEPNIANPSILRADDTQNYGSSAPSRDGYTNELGRMDVNINAKNRSFFNVRHTDYFQTKNDYYGNIATGSDLSRSNWGLTFDHVYMMNAGNVLNVKANFTRMFEDHRAPGQGFDPTTLGLPAYLKTNSTYVQLPYITFASTNTLVQALGMNGANKLPSQSLQLFGNWVAIRGNHQLKFGGDVRQYRLNYGSFGSATGNFAFSANTWVRQQDNSSSTVVAGQDLAEFLLGLPTGGQYDINGSSMFYQYYAAGFAQDDWRVKRNLTLNIGVRFDRDFPWREKWARTVNGFAFNTPSPLNDAATAAYAKSPAPILPASDFRVMGGLTFASSDNNAIYKSTSHLVSPRFGFAWTPERFRGKTVVRGGLGMFVSALGISTLQVTGAYSTNPLLTQEGFNQTTTLNPSNDSYLSPAATLSNPFPNGITPMAGAKGGLATFMGSAIQFFNPEMKNPYAVRWNLNVQHSIRPNLVLEVLYMGNHGVHLPVTYTQLNSISRRYMSTSPVRDQAVINAITAAVPNPFNGLQISGTPSGTSSTISTAQLLAKYPQFPVGFTSGTLSGSGGVVQYLANVGSSYYQSLNVRLTKRFSRGFSLTANFIRSKMIERVSWLNFTDPQPEKRISPFDHPSRLVLASVYDLPFGKNRLVKLQSRGARLAFGGWKTSATYTYQVGAPLSWLNGSTNNISDYVYLGVPIKLNKRGVDGKAFDTAAFDTNSANALQYHIRTFSTTFPNLRQDGINQFDASLRKSFNITEKGARFELACNAFNVINHPTFAAPNTAWSNANFGTITGQSNRVRVLEFSGKFSF
jgi:hypothetical protein